MKYGICVAVKAEKRGERLALVIIVDHEDYGRVSAQLPDREKSALLPRSLLCPEVLELSEGSLPVLTETAEKLIVGRKVKIWKFREEWYCGVPSWRAVKIIC